MPISPKQTRFQAAGHYLRTLREAREMTCQDLAVRIGLEPTSKHMITMIEKGNAPLPKERWADAAKALGANEPVFGELMLKRYLPEIYTILYDQLGMPKSASRTPA